MNRSAKLLIDVFEKLQSLQRNQLDLVISFEALLIATQEAFPNISYDRHFEAAKQSEKVQKLREQLRVADVNIEATKRALSGESN